MISNGNTIDCDTKYPEVPILVQGHTFLDLFQLPIGGADIVLGVQWLKQLGLITTDYSSLTMRFTYENQPIALCADVPIHPSPASAQQVKRLAQTHSISALFKLTRVTTPTPPLPTSHPLPLFTPTLHWIVFFSDTQVFSKNPPICPRHAPLPTTSIYSQTPTPLMYNLTGTPIPRKMSSRGKSPPCWTRT